MNPLLSHFPHLARRLRWQLGLYALLAFAFCCSATYHSVAEDLPPLFALGGFLGGGLIGVVFSRMQRLSWDEAGQKIIGRFDAIGALLLLAYIPFETYRRELVALFVHGPAVLVASLGLVAGLMVGRVIGIRGRVADILRERQVRGS